MRAGDRPAPDGNEPAAAMKIGLVGCGKQAVEHISGLRKCREAEFIPADKYFGMLSECEPRQNLSATPVATATW